MQPTKNTCGPGMPVTTACSSRLRTSVHDAANEQLTHPPPRAPPSGAPKCMPCMPPPALTVNTMDLLPPMTAVCGPRGPIMCCSIIWANAMPGSSSPCMGASCCGSGAEVAR